MYPAQAVLQALQPGDDKNAESEFKALWVGSEDGMERELIQHTGASLPGGLPFKAIPAAGVHGVGWRALPGNIFQLLKGLGASLRILREFQPEVLLFTGGFVAVPMAIAARTPQPGVRRPRSLSFVPDIEPGLALKVVSRVSDRVAASTADTQKFFSARRKVQVTGYPLRPDLFQWNRLTAQQKLGLTPDLPTLLVFGGSKGARTINRALMAILPQLLQSMQVVHLSGRLDWEVVLENARTLPADLTERYHAFPYLHEEMGAALAAADLAVSRAGASCLGEFPYFGLPAILVPYPYAWRYQYSNAEYLVRQQAAVLLTDGELSTRLLPLVRELIQDASRREAMRRALRNLSRPQAAQELAGLLKEMAGKESRLNG